MTKLKVKFYKLQAVSITEACSDTVMAPPDRCHVWIVLSADLTDNIYQSVHLFPCTSPAAIKNSHLPGQDLWCLGSKLACDGSHARPAASPWSLMGLVLMASLNHGGEYETWARWLAISKTTQRGTKTGAVRSLLEIFQTFLHRKKNKGYLFSPSSLLFQIVLQGVEVYQPLRVSLSLYSFFC